MNHPPKQIGGANVILFTTIEERHRPTGGCRQIVSGVLQGPAESLAICQYEGEEYFYLFGCDAAWNSVTDTWHQSIEEAMDQAEFEYEGVASTWRRFGIPELWTARTPSHPEAPAMRVPWMSTRRSITRALVATWAVAAIGLWVITAVREVSPTGRILSAARRRVPGIVIQSMQPETFNRRQAWEVRGIDREGTEWMLDISASGEILMSEPVAYGPPRTMVEPYGQ